MRSIKDISLLSILAIICSITLSFSALSNVSATPNNPTSNACPKGYERKNGRCEIAPGSTTNLPPTPPQNAKRVSAEISYDFNVTTNSHDSGSNPSTSGSGGSTGGGTSTSNSWHVTVSITPAVTDDGQRTQGVDALIGDTVKSSGDKPKTNASVQYEGGESLVYRRSNVKNGTITLAADHNLNTTCNIEIPDGTSMEELNNRVKKCAQSIASWKFGNATTSYSYSGVKFKSTDGKTEDITSADTSGNSAEDKEKCYKEAGTMGWIICPIVYGLGDAASGLYEKVEPMLRVDSTIVTDLTNQDGGTYRGWSIFRDFANIVFVIMLLVVILSQVTGVGVSNYGIKKILPRLITTAILVNLSFILCRVAIDVSNIVGANIKSIFDSIANSIPMNIDTTAIGDQGTFAGIIALILGAIGLGAGVAAAASFVAGSGWALILPILLALLTAAAAVFFAFLVLGARQALVVVLTVLSPLAIILYMLPNTSNIFQKWVKVFQGILLVYPLCGLLIGAGNLVARILLSSNSGNFFMLIIAAVICVVPYFFIPTLLMKSVNAVGNIGSRIMQGSRLARAGVGNLKKTDAYQRGMTSLRSRGINNPNSLRAKIARSRLGRATGAEMSMARASAAAQKQRQTDRQAAASLKAQAYPNRGLNDILEKFDDTTGEDLNVMVEEADYSDMPHATDFIAEKMNGWDLNGEGGEKHISQLLTLREFARNNSAFANAMKERNRDAFDMIMQAGAKNEDGSYKNLSDFTKGLDLSSQEWFTQSNSTLKRGIDAKSLTPEAAGGVINSTDPSIQSNLNQEKRKIFSGVAGTSSQSSGSSVISAEKRENDSDSANANTNQSESTGVSVNINANQGGSTNNNTGTNQSESAGAGANTDTGTNQSESTGVSTNINANQGGSTNNNNGINANTKNNANYNYKAGSGRHMPKGGAENNRMDIPHDK